jgi:hypothetical protein
MTATSIFGEPPTKQLVGLWSMEIFDTYQKRLREACRRVGGQSEMARQASALINQSDSLSNVDPDDRPAVSPSLVQYLCREGKDGDDFKPAQGSALTPVFAHLAGLEALWLAHGIGPMDRSHSEAANEAAEYVDSKPTEKREAHG